MPPTILIALSQVAELAGEPNGTYFPELSHFLAPIVDAGYPYVLATPGGGAAPVYGDRRDDPINARFLDDPEFQRQLASTRPIAEIDPSQFAAIFYPGGYGVLFDLAQHAGFAAVAKAIHQRGGWLSAVCHGPAGLLPVTDASGGCVLAGRLVTSFTREEEIAYGTIEKIPYLLEQRLVDAGARFVRVAAWGENGVVDGRVVTGQNPASAGFVGRTLVANLAG
jgi:putative intracellular protease/amidase